MERFLVFTDHTMSIIHDAFSDRFYSIEGTIAERAGFVCWTIWAADWNTIEVDATGIGAAMHVALLAHGVSANLSFPWER